MKEAAIREFLSKVDWSKNWSYQVLENEMKSFLGERPTLDIKYQKDVSINENTQETIEIQKLVSVSVIFTDDKDKIKKLEFLID